MADRKKEVLELLEKVQDPEVGLDIVNLGLIYDIIEEEEKIIIKMTLTTPTCPMGPYILSEVQEALRKLDKDVEVHLVWDPPWSAERISEKGKIILGIE